MKTIEQLQADLAARDALIGELRERIKELEFVNSLRVPGSCQCGDDDLCAIAKDSDRLRAVTEAADWMKNTLTAERPHAHNTHAPHPSVSAYDAARSGAIPEVWHGKLVRVGTFEQGGETITGFICETTREYIQSLPTIRMYEQVTVSGAIGIKPAKTP